MGGQLVARVKHGDLDGRLVEELRQLFDDELVEVVGLIMEARLQMTANLPWAMASLYFDFFHAERVNEPRWGLCSLSTVNAGRRQCPERQQVPKFPLPFATHRSFLLRILFRPHQPVGAI